MSNRGRALMRGAAWLYGAQLATMVIQFFYAAITSRNVDAAGFGAYAVALTVSSFVSLLANGGLGQTAGRLGELEPRVIGSLVTFALCLGSVAALILFVTADFWAWVWSTPAAAGPLRWLTISAFIGPFIGLATGLMRRTGRFRALAVMTIAANVLGMCGGAIGVLVFHSPEALLISPVTAQVLTALLVTASCRHKLLRARSLRYGRSHVAFSIRVTFSSVLSYTTGNVGPWAATTFFSPAVLGQWNRSDVITTIPFQQVQTAMIQALYPEFRHDTESPDRARVVWSEMLTLVAWAVFPLVAVVATCAPVALPLLFGPGWELAATLTIPLAVVAGAQIITVTLASAVEAIGRFRWVFPALAFQLAVVTSAVSLAIITRDIRIVIFGFGAGLIALHALHLMFCRRGGYIRLRVVAAGYLGAFTASAAAACALLAIRWSVDNLSSQPWGLPLVLAASTALGLATWRFRGQLPPIKIARRYKLI